MKDLCFLFHAVWDCLTHNLSVLSYISERLHSEWDAVLLPLKLSNLHVDSNQHHCIKLFICFTSGRITEEKLNQVNNGHYGHLLVSSYKYISKLLPLPSSIPFVSLVSLGSTLHFFFLIFYSVKRYLYFYLMPV